MLLHRIKKSGVIMSQLEIALWSGCVGIYTSYVCLSLFYAAYNRSFAGLQVTLYASLCGAFVLMGSGLAAQLMPGLPKLMEQRLVILLGALAGAYSAVGLRNFLRAEQRDAFVGYGMLVVVVICTACLLALGWHNTLQALEVVAVVVSMSCVLAFWFTLRAWLLGDRFALPMALACIAMILGVMGVFATALQAIDDHVWLQALVAISAALFVVIVIHTTQHRYADYLRMRRALEVSRDKDLLTQLWTGAAFIRQIDDAISRARRNRKEMAVICVEIYNAASLRQEFGHNAFEQVIYGMAMRIRQYGGTANFIGRYGDTSFVLVYDSVKQPSYLRSLSLRLAQGARRPYMLNAFSTDPREFQADIGVGLSRISSGREAQKRPSDTSYAAGLDSMSLAQDVLHEAAELALASKQFSSRAATLDGISRKPVPLDDMESR
jgi:diguanylate cyclase (GGDEF)-like protein